MTTLLISPDGMLGRAFAIELGRRGGEVVSASHPAIDITREGSIAEWVRPPVRRVINCAAFTDVDGAETKEEEASAINGHAVGKLARRCREIGAGLVHFGTDYVFAGTAREPYAIDAALAPQGAYGRSKALGEELLRESGAEHLYLRTSWLYAPWGKNFVRTIATLSRSKDTLRVVHDQRGRPTSAEHLARAALALWDREARGTLHVTDGGECTWFELATEIVRGIGARCVVQPCTTEEFVAERSGAKKSASAGEREGNHPARREEVRPARRPAYSVLDLSRTEALLGPMPEWRANLADVLSRLE